MKRPAAALLGCVVLLLLLTAVGIASIPTLQTGTWHSMGLMGVARSGAAAVLLKDHRVLIAGGDDGTGAVTSAEVFNADGSFSEVSAMGMARAKHVAVALADGRVLVAGGEGAGGGTTNSAEIYDPLSDSWTAIAGGMLEGRAGATATLLKDGRVLIAGGRNGNAASQSVEVFDPLAEHFEFAGSLSAPRMSLASAILPDGRVLMVGGSNGSAALATSDIFDPAANTVYVGPAMTSPREGHSATALLDGSVLVVGGNNGSADLASAEIYDPTTKSFALLASAMASPRQDHAAILLPNNHSVLIVGGTSAGNELNTAETFTPWTGIFAATGSAAVARQQSAVSALNQDGLLVMLGGTSGGTPVSSAELYGFATVKTDAADYPPGSVVTITGTGWQPGETVTLGLVESPLVDTHPVVTAIADGQGNIANSEFSPDEHDVDIRFYLTAVGNQSGYQAQNTFTDGNATISGKVTSSATGNPIQGATVSCTALTGCNITTSTTTAADGTYSFKPSFAGNGPATISLTASATGFNSATSAPINIQNNAQVITGINFALNPSVVPTTTTVASSPNPSVFGASVTFTADVHATSGSLAPSGTVQFVVDGVSFGSAVALGACSPPNSTDACASVSNSTLTVNGGTAHTVSANYLHTGVFVDSTGALAGGQTVGKAAPAITWSSPADITYGTALSATQLNATAAVPGTFAYTPAAGTILNAGGGQDLHVDFTPTDSTNYATASKDVTINVNKKQVTASITANDKPYDGNTTATINACTIPDKVGSDDVACTASNATFASPNASSSAQTVTATVALTGGAAGNYMLTSTTATTTAKINMKSATPSITADDKDYDGTNAATIHCSVAGVLAADTANVTCSGTGTFADANAGPAKAVTSNNLVLGGIASGNYVLSTTSATTTATIRKVDATINVSGYSVAYNATAHMATGTATGVGSVDLSAGLNLTGTSHTDAGDYPADAWTFTGGQNYNDKNGTVHDHIDKANAVIDVTPYSVTYNGAAHTATGTATGVGGVDLSAGLNLTGTSHTDAGDYPADAWTFTGGQNYNDKNGTVHDHIDKANAVIDVTPYSVTYNGAAHTATGTATGVGGVDLSAWLNLTGTSHTDAGDYPADAWTFTGGQNYNDKNGTVHDHVDKADATVSVTPYSVTYNGGPHTATGTAIGVGGVDFSASFNFTGTSHTDAGDYPADAWSFSGGMNYNDRSGTVHDHVDKAPVTATAGGGTAMFDGNTKTPSACVVSGAYTGDLACTNNPASVGPNAGTTAIAAMVNGTTPGNFQIAYVPGSFTIDKATSTTTMTFEPGPYVYRGTAFTATATVAGAGGLNAAVAPVSYSGDCVNVTAPGCTGTATYPGDGNHIGSTGNASIAITPAAPTITVTGGNFVYDGNPHPATGAAKGIGGVAVPGSFAFTYTPPGTAAIPVNPGSYSVIGVFSSSTANYTSGSAAAAITLNYGVCSAAIGPGSVILPPINSDGSSVYPRKGGSTIPVKFRVCSASGGAISNPAAVFAGTGGSLTMLSAVRGTIDNINETTGTDIPDVAFRWDASGQQWIFNMGTNNLSSGNTYLYRINLANGSIPFAIGVK
ncbi:MAG TPA: kelch repeat-containing protein [Candidatus Eisenbacteria bacterium]|nr:kelch repeat-containing protein [Candidatus Eisenbacteria bacterium]